MWNDWNRRSGWNGLRTVILSRASLIVKTICQQSQLLVKRSINMEILYMHLTAREPTHAVKDGSSVTYHTLLSYAWKGYNNLAEDEENAKCTSPLCSYVSESLRN